MPPNIKTAGKIHPISQTIFNIIEIFGSLNYLVETGPDIESDFNNFTALNIPEHHPAREMQDSEVLHSGASSSRISVPEPSEASRCYPTNRPPPRAHAQSMTRLPMCNPFSHKCVPVCVTDLCPCARSARWSQM